MTREERLRMAEAVRQACVTAAAEAFEQTGIQGLCADGRLEAALGAIRRLDVAALMVAS